MDVIARYRAKAAELRERANSVDYIDVRSELIALADQYDHMADAREAMVVRTKDLES